NPHRFKNAILQGLPNAFEMGVVSVAFIVNLSEMVFPIGIRITVVNQHLIGQKGEYPFFITRSGRMRSVKNIHSKIIVIKPKLALVPLIACLYIKLDAFDVSRFDFYI